MYVLDATPLIYLAKAGQLSVFDGLSTTPVIPRPFYDEVVTAGLEQGYADARRIQQGVDDALFVVEAPPDTTLADQLPQETNLTAADTAVLAMAAARDAVAVMDEQYGRDVAAAEGIQTRGTAYLVLEAVREGRLSPETGRETIEAMVDAGWYCSPALYARIQSTLDDLA